ncbi:DUF1090 family protein [Providencia rettgeri]
MKCNIIFLLLISLTSFPTFSGNHDYGCEKRLYFLEKKLNYAKKNDNRYKVVALERAIEKTKRYCYDDYSGATGPTQLYDDYLYSTEIKKLEKEISEIKKMMVDLQDNR